MDIRHRYTRKIMFASVTSPVSLRNADLCRSDLCRAYLYDADLREADLHGANLSETYGVVAAGTPDTVTTYGWLRDGKLSLCVGGHEKRLDEARAYWTNTHPLWHRRRDIAVAIEYIAAVAKIRGWTL